jgi:hypothetical protein
MGQESHYTTLNLEDTNRGETKPRDTTGGARTEPEDLEVHPTPPHKKAQAGKTFLHPDETIEDLMIKDETDLSVGTTNIGAKPSKDPIANV